MPRKKMDSKPAPPPARLESAQEFEKLGVFYLGRRYDPASKQTKPEFLLYDSKDLVTHAVCVGMTGSGKTGLCIGLLEEAAIDGIPALIIDPKGDLANLLLTFPRARQPKTLRPGSTKTMPGRRVSSSADYAAQQAELWKKGLAEVGARWLPHSKAPRCGRVRRVHAGQQCGDSGVDPQLVCGASAGNSRGCRVAARANRYHGHESPWPDRSASRSGQEP